MITYILLFGFIIIQQTEIILSMKKDKLCENCRYFINDNLSLGKCLLFPKVYKKDITEKRRDLKTFLTTGVAVKNKKQTDYIYCLDARNSQYMCGKDGKKYVDR
jgi:hypothetical protein